MKLFLLARLEGFFHRLERWAAGVRERCAFCPDCGRNRYTGKPCV